MLPSQQVAALLSRHFPVLAPDLTAPTGAVLPLEQQLRQFAGFTRHAALRGQLVCLRACLQLANELLQWPDPDLSAALLRTYLPALRLNDVPQDPQLVCQFMPAPLYRALCRLPQGSPAAG